MGKIKKKKIFVSDDGEYLSEPIEVVEMTKGLEKKLREAIDIVHKCGMYVTDGTERNNNKMDYSSKNFVIAYLLLSTFFLLVSGVVFYQGHLLISVLLLGFVLLFQFGIYHEIKKH